jgi:hypothetical protein
VVSYNTLMTFVDAEDKARAVLKEMEDKGVTPDEVTRSTIIKSAATFETALALIDLFLLKKDFVGRGTFEATFAKSIIHLTAGELLIEYNKRAFKFDTSLQSPINQYRKAGLFDQALALTLFAPHVGASQKFYREDFDRCKEYFRSEIMAGNNDDNLFYAFGIAASLNGDWENAEPNLKIALDRAYAEKRISHIQELLSVAMQLPLIPARDEEAE